MTVTALDPEPARDLAVASPPAEPLADLGVRGLFVEQADAKLKSIRRAYGLAVEQLSATYRHVVMRTCTSETTVDFLVQVAEMEGRLSDERRAGVTQRRADFLASALAAQQEAAARIKQTMDEYAARERSFGEFIDGILRGNLALDGAAAALALAVPLAYFLSASVAVLLLFLLLLALYLGSAVHRARIMRARIRAIGQEAWLQVEALGHEYVEGVRHDLS